MKNYFNIEFQKESSRIPVITIYKNSDFATLMQLIICWVNMKQMSMIYIVNNVILNEISENENYCKGNFCLPNIFKL